MTAWITDSSGREQRTRIISISDALVTGSVGDDVREFRMPDLRRIRVRRSDSLLNGALIGAGAMVGTGLFMCNLMERWENCRDDVGPMVRLGLVGAGIGIGVDALFRFRRTVFERGPGSADVRAIPLVGPAGGGLQVSVKF